MKTSRIIQFGLAAVLLSIGCIFLITNAATGFATICFCLATFALYRRSELSRSVPAREALISVGVLAALAAFIILANHLISRTTGEHFVQQPLVVGIFWVAAMAALFWRWSRERRSNDA